MRRLRRPTLLMIAAAVLAAFGLVGTLFFSGDDDPFELVTDDEIDDCREAGRDTGERCDPGADIDVITLSVEGQKLIADFAFTEPPEISDEIMWSIQFFAEFENAVICGLSNVLDVANPAEDLSAYALDPATRDALGPDVCDARLEGSSAVFTIDVAGQPDDAEFRLLGSIKLDFPDNVQPGSEDDFFIRTTLAELQP